MGKKLAGGPRRRPGNGPAGNSSSSSGSSLVVVNPMHMQSTLRAAPSSSSKQSKQKPKQGNNTNKKRKADGATDNGSGKKQKKSKRQNDREDDGGGSFTARKFGKRVQKSPVVSTHVSSVVTSAGLFGADDGLKRPISLIVQKEEHLLAGAYWIALSRGAKRSCVVVVPNSMAPQTVAGVFRNVGFQALAIHKKMTMGQRKEAIERLASSMELVSEASQVVLVTPEHFAGATTVCSGADVLLLNVKPQQSYSKFSAIFQVMTGGDVSSYRPELTNALLQQVSARLKLATQITEIAQRLGKSNAKDIDSKWATKLAKGADLSDEDEMGGGGASSDDEDGAGRNKKKKSKGKKALSPDEQRLQALTEKLVLLVARKLEVPSGKKNQQQGNDGAAAVASDNNQNGKEKLEVLGLVTLNAAVGASMGDERFSAQTQWMDAASGQQFGGAWNGSVRHGASKDASSLALRKKFCAVLKKKDGDKLSEWRPNKNPSDLDTWGGEYGKVCGHNEVVMQSLRPFYPQEVLNSKVCSRMFPAPGNQGFDGCLEHLRLQCMAQKRAMTLWDAEYFIYITGAGQVTWTKKNQLLALSLASLQCAVSNLRAWTLASRGCIPPKRVVEALQICCELGSGDLQSPALEMKLLKRVMSFAIGGSVRLWKQIAKLPRPLEEEIVY